MAAPATFRFDFVDRGSGDKRLSIRTGSTWKFKLRVKDTTDPDNPVPIDITSWTFQMMVRKTAASDAVIVELSSTNSRITITDGPNGEFQLALTPAETTALLADAGINVYDIKYTVSGDTKTLGEGQIEILASPTR